MKIVSSFVLREDLVSMLMEMGEYIEILDRKIELEDVRDAEIVIGNISPQFLPFCERLKYLQLLSAGSDLYKEYVCDRYVICNASGTFGANIAEHLLMYTLLFYRNMPHYWQKQSEHEYCPLRHNQTIYGSRFLICGCGDIGTQFAKRIQALGGYTIGVKRNHKECLPYFDEVHTQDKLDCLLNDVDVIALCLPRNENTNHFLNKERLHKVKSTAFIFNVGRSNAIDTEALCECLNQGSIAGAALDVFDEEPLPNTSSLWKTKNLIMTPHVSGTFANLYTYELFYNIVKENILLYKKGKQLRNRIDKKYGYRIEE